MTSGRRANGEGSVYYERQLGCWRAVVTCPNGRKRARVAHSRKEAMQKLEELKRELSAGIYEGRGNPCLRDYMHDWVENVASRRVRPHTLICYRRTERWIADTIGNVKLRGVSRHDVRQALLGISHMSPAAIRTRHAGFRVAMQAAVDEGLIPSNPAAKVPLPKIQRREMTTLNERQLHQLLALVEDPSWRCLWTLLSSTGMRIGEALGLRWPYVDLDRQFVQIVASLSRMPGQWDLHEPKSARSRRLVYLSRSAVEGLRARRRAQNLDRLKCGRGWANEWDLVFTAANGAPVYSADASRLLTRDLRAAGLPHIRVHDLRHTAATLALQRGIHPKMVADMLGHSSIAITMDLYSHTTPAMHRQVADTMDLILGWEYPGLDSKTAVSEVQSKGP